MTFYRAIATEGASLLAPHGAVFVEVGDGQAATVNEVMTGTAVFARARSRKDRVVGQERVLMFARCG